MSSTSTSPSSGAKQPARLASAIARFLLGLPLVAFGLNAFLNFLPPPPPDALPEAAVAFATALMNSGFMMPLIGTTQLVVGLLLLLNRFVPLALVLFAPFLVNAVAFHLALERSGLPMVAIFVGLEAYLAWVHRAAYRPLLTARWQPE